MSIFIISHSPLDSAPLVVHAVIPMTQILAPLSSGSMTFVAQSRRGKVSTHITLADRVQRPGPARGRPVSSIRSTTPRHTCPRALSKSESRSATVMWQTVLAM
jgi:hypothetical protein